MVFNLFKKKKDKSSLTYDSLKVKEVIRETPDAITVVFEHPQAGKLEYKSGQFLTCIFDVGGIEERRCYSLNTSPYKQVLPAITIKKDPEGKVSNFIFSNLKEGDVLRILMPTGNFTTEFDENNKRHFVLVAGGSGITPLMSILLSALEKEPQSFITLIYANRDESSIIFKKQLEELALEKPEQLNVIHILSRPSAYWHGHKGRLLPETLDKILEEIPQFENTEYYLCGPAGLMDMVEKFLVSRSIDKKNIRKESFSKEEVEVKPGEIVPGDVTVIIGNEEFTFHVKPDKTILEAALDNDIDLPYSCQSGICSTCRCLKLEGEVKMDEDEGLTDEEIGEGYVLVCVGHPLTRKVTLKNE
jgi:ring-1,2-phenylacetyl-CoA epoxidase subunit PaaE